MISKELLDIKINHVLVEMCVKLEGKAILIMAVHYLSHCFRCLLRVTIALIKTKLPKTTIITLGQVTGVLQSYQSLYVICWLGIILFEQDQ